MKYIYSKTFNIYFETGDNMIVARNCGFLFFSSIDFNGKDIKSIPLWGAGVFDMLTYQLFFIGWFNTGYDYFVEVKKSMKNKYKFQFNTID